MAKTIYIEIAADQLERLIAIKLAATGLVNAPEFDKLLPETAHGKMVEICAERLKKAVDENEQHQWGDS